MSDAPSLGSVDIDAVQEAVDVLTEAGFQIPGIDGIDREASDDDRVRWTMTVEKDARTADLSDFDMGDR